MTNDEVKVAAVLAFHRFCAEQNIATCNFGDEVKMAWMAAFVEGCHWSVDKTTTEAIEMRRQEHEETMRLLLQEGKA